MTPSLQDERGCLTPAGFAAIRDAPAGQAPPEAARHLAGCPRCQSRLLASARPAPDPAQSARLRWIRAGAYLLLGASLLAGFALAVLSLVRR